MLAWLSVSSTQSHREVHNETVTVVQSQFCFQCQLLGFPDGLQPELVSNEVDLLRYFT